MLHFAYYKQEMTNLGLLQFAVYKLKNLLARMPVVKGPLTYTSKHAQFPLKFRPRTTDPWVFRQIFVELEYKPLTDIRDVRLVLDCGANVGYSSAFFLTQFPKSQVIAIEPDPDNFSLLEKNLAPYKGRFQAIRSAIWSRPAKLVLSEDRIRPRWEWARTVREAKEGEPGTIIATDIGTVLKESGFDRISILKIDIEGAEAIVFSSDYREWLPKVDNVAIELHDEDCSSIFFKAIAGENFELSTSDELVLCKRRSREPVNAGVRSSR
jgi:FkbM family methyltransferase